MGGGGRKQEWEKYQENVKGHARIEKGADNKN